MIPTWIGILSLLYIPIISIVDYDRPSKWSKATMIVLFGIFAIWLFQPPIPISEVERCEDLYKTTKDLNPGNAGYEYLDRNCTDILVKAAKDKTEVISWVIAIVVMVLLPILLYRVGRERTPEEYRKLYEANKPRKRRRGNDNTQIRRKNGRFG